MDKYKPVKHTSQSIRHKVPDELERMSFGQYEFERFERVPRKYMIWLKYSGISLARYPNLKNFIDNLETDDYLD